MAKLIDIEDFRASNVELKKYIDEEIKKRTAESVHQAESFLSFPIVGNASTIYIDTSTNKTYRWSADELKYYVIGSDYNDIDIINTNF